MTNSVARELRLREQREANRRSKQRAVDLGGGYGRGPAPLKSASQKSAEPSAEELEAFYREVGPELEFYRRPRKWRNRPTTSDHRHQQNTLGNLPSSLGASLGAGRRSAGVEGLKGSPTLGLTEKEELSLAMALSESEVAAHAGPLPDSAEAEAGAGAGR
eukprot:CAMPEP_0172625292 /NCGR_PEP_ID=MMETSP1068-20121228/142813_1 /TAXON_ID=35684 /ORGANISM="Pseudopedinella elastica, Strain CCMP716" /LENGTH=159 /DNA_ID=CAMNT_0013434539 /DNA_START=18 /DNA_END=497 /DNA_ORIENTATION=-